MEVTAALLETGKWSARATGSDNNEVTCRLLSIVWRGGEAAAGTERCQSQHTGHHVSPNITPVGRRE